MTTSPDTFDTYAAAPATQPETRSRGQRDLETLKTSIIRMERTLGVDRYLYTRAQLESMLCCEVETLRALARSMVSDSRGGRS